MNPNREMYGRLTINGDKKSLGKAMSLNIMLHRIAEQYAKHKYAGGKMNLLVELSYDPLPEASLMSREDMLQHELNSHIITDPDQLLDNGLTVGRVNEMLEDADFERYRRFCVAANRIGVSNDIIASTQRVVFERFGEDVHKLAVWQDR